MSTPVIRYPFDPTGINQNNLVVGELQTMPARKIRAVAPEYGPFYTKGLVITDTATNLPLTPDQFYCAEFETMASLETGLEVMRIIMITDQTVSSTISLQYQVVGGEYSASADAIIQQIYNLNLDDRPAAWPLIIDKPAAFNPSAHLHDVGDLVGFEYTVAALDRISKAILLGDEASHDAIYKYIDLGTSSIASQIQALQNALNAHLADFGNPHKVTAAQVGAYTTQQSDANLSAVQTTLQNNINAVDAALVSHENNTSNPHQVTAAQVGAYTKGQSDSNLNAATTTWNNNLTANVNNLQNQINGKQPVGNYAVQGTDVQFNNITATGTIWCYNDIWAFVSDERLKENIRTIKSPLAKIHQLHGVTYNHTEAASQLLNLKRERRYMGLLAGEVEKIAPEVVDLAAFDRDEHGLSVTGQYFKTLQYEKLMGLMVEAVKAVDLKIDSVTRAIRQAGLGSFMPIEDVEPVEYVESPDLLAA